MVTRYDFWTRMPSSWVTRGGLSVFAVGEPGLAIASLKIYLLAAARSGRLSATGEDTVRLTYDDIEENAAVARVLIRSALDQLTSLLEPTGRSLYRLCGYPVGGSGGWCMVPARHIMATRLFASIDARSRMHLIALKFYLLLLALRNPTTNEASVGYEKICEYLGVRRNDIPKAGAVLHGLGVIRIHPGKGNFRAEEAAVNRYGIVGLFPSGEREQEPVTLTSGPIGRNIEA